MPQRFLKIWHKSKVRHKSTMGNYLKSEKLRLFRLLTVTNETREQLAPCYSTLLRSSWSAHDKLSGLGFRMFIMWNPFWREKILYKQQKWLKKIASQHGDWQIWWRKQGSCLISPCMCIYRAYITISAISSGHPSS